MGVGRDKFIREVEANTNLHRQLSICNGGCDFNELF
jgi:hypothetical protein